MFDIIDRQDLNEEQKCAAIRELIEQDPAALSCVKLGLSPLHYAVIKHLPKVIKTLIDLGSPINATEYNQLTPLHLAAENGFSDIVLLLGYNQCDFNALDSLQETALDKAIKNHHPACVKNLLLISQFPIDKIVHLGVINNLPQQVQYHLNLGAPINTQDNQGKTALHYAVLCNHQALLLQLCYHDTIDMNCVDNEGNTALHLSVTMGHAECIKILVTSKNPIDKTIKNKANLTAAELLSLHQGEELTLLQKAFSSTQVSNTQSEEMEKEIFNFESENPSNLIPFLKEHFKELDLSIKILMDNVDSPRRYGDGSINKLLKRKSSSPRNKSNNLVSEQPLQVKDKVSFFDSVDAAYLKNDVTCIVNRIQTGQSNEDYAFLIEECSQLIQKYPSAPVGLFLNDLMDELQQLLMQMQHSFNKQNSAFQSGVQKKLLADGMKKMTSIQEINRITKEDLSHISKYGKSLEVHLILVRLCSGELINSNKVIFDLHGLLTNLLGLMDAIEPHQLIAYLTQLNPLFSKEQRLQSHYAVLRLIELLYYYGFDVLEGTLAHAINDYVETCCDEALKTLVTSYKTELELFKKNALHSFIERLRRLLIPSIESPKDAIMDKIYEFVNYNTTNIKYNKKLLGCVEYIAREFNTINARFYRNLLLKDIRKTYWKNDDPQSSLMDYTNDIMSGFIGHTVTLFTNAQKQAQAITLFILVARESLHYYHGVDMVTVLTTLCALNKLEQIKGLKEAFGLLDKNTLLIKESLTQLTSPFYNFKPYRELLASESLVFPLFEVIGKDKVYLYEDLDLELATPLLGKIHYTLLSIKKSLSGLSLVSQSDLYEKLHVKYTIPNEVSNSLSSKEEVSTESSPRKHLSSRKTSQSKDYMPRKGLSMRKSSAEKEAARKELSLSHHKALSLFSSSAPTLSPKDKESKTEKNHMGI